MITITLISISIFCASKAFWDLKFSLLFRRIKEQEIEINDLIIKQKELEIKFLNESTSTKLDQSMEAIFLQLNQISAKLPLRQAVEERKEESSK